MCHFFVCTEMSHAEVHTDCLVLWSTFLWFTVFLNGRVMYWISALKLSACRLVSTVSACCQPVDRVCSASGLIFLSLQRQRADAPAENIQQYTAVVLVDLEVCAQNDSFSVHSVEGTTSDPNVNKTTQQLKARLELAITPKQKKVFPDDVIGLFTHSRKQAYNNNW